MSTFVCPHCGENSAIFGEGGGDRIAEEFSVPVLARLPLSLEARQTSDAGRPIANEGDSVAGKIFKTLADEVLQLLANQTAPTAPMISIVDD
jgi:ATP-binding protein involved in chromosome partitioning